MKQRTIPVSCSFGKSDMGWLRSMQSHLQGWSSICWIIDSDPQPVCFAAEKARVPLFLSNGSFGVGPMYNLYKGRGQHITPNNPTEMPLMSLLGRPCRGPRKPDSTEPLKPYGIWFGGPLPLLHFFQQPKGDRPVTGR